MLKLPRASLSINFSSNFIDPDEEFCDNNKKIEKLDYFMQNNRIKDWSSDTKNKLRSNSVKLFIDGVFESGTALVSNCNCSIDNYAFSDDELENIFDYLYKNELQIHCHCIGDLATTKVLDSLEKSIKKNENIPNIQNNYMAHLQLVNENDYTRFKELNVSTSFSPYWFMKDSYSEKLEEIVGKERIKNIYPVNYLKDQGVRITFGSDWPVSTPNPLEGIEVAVTHRPLAVNDEEESYIPEHKISLHEAIKFYTLSSAELLGLDKISGSLEVGKCADLIILDKNIFEIKENKIHTSKVILTMINGITVFNKRI